MHFGASRSVVCLLGAGRLPAPQGPSHGSRSTRQAEASPPAFADEQAMGCALEPVIFRIASLPVVTPAAGSAGRHWTIVGQGLDTLLSTDTKKTKF